MRVPAASAEPSRGGVQGRRERAAHPAGSDMDLKIRNISNARKKGRGTRPLLVLSDSHYFVWWPSILYLIYITVDERSKVISLLGMI